MKLQPTIAQLYLVDGTPQTDAIVPGLYAQPAPDDAVRSRQNDVLLLHLSLSGPIEENRRLQKVSLGTFTAEFYAASGSVTAAMRRAIQATNQYLLASNQKAEGPRRSGALSCAVFRGGELYMAQVGEAFAYIGRSFGLERIPAAEPSTITPLGLTAGLDIRYSHNWLQQAETLLLADPRVAHIETQMLVPSLVGTDIVGAQRGLRDLMQNNSARLLVTMVDYQPAATYPADVPAIAVAPPPPVSVPEATPATPLCERVYDDEREPAYEPEFVPEPEPDVVYEAYEVEETSETVSVSGQARRATARSLGGLSVFAGWLARVFGRLRRPEAPLSRRETWLFGALAIAIPIIVMLVIMSVYFRTNEVQRMAQIDSQISVEMRAGQAALEAGGNSADSRRHFTNVIALADEADRIREGDSAVAQQRATAMQELDRLDGVSRLDGTLLHDFDDDVALTQLVLSPTSAPGYYVLNDPGNEVLWLPAADDYLSVTGERPRVAIEQAATADIIDMIWQPNSATRARSGLAVLDWSPTNGILLTYDPAVDRPDRAQLGLASDWINPVAIATFQGRLYVLDTGNEQIWRYLPSESGFNIDGEDLAIELPDLNNAIDVAINAEDGSVIVLYRDGGLRRYLSGDLLWDENTLLANGLGTPLEAPTRLKIIGSGLNSTIFVADPGTSRIIQLSLRQGDQVQIVAQYKARDENGAELFDNVSDFTVAETPLRIFTVAGDMLHVSTVR